MLTDITRTVIKPITERTIVQLPLELEKKPEAEKRKPLIKPQIEKAPVPEKKVKIPAKKTPVKVKPLPVKSKKPA